MAIQKYPYLKPEPVFVLHRQVIELHPEKTRGAETFNMHLNKDQRNGIIHPESVGQYKSYKCLCCGLEWKESISSPTIVDSHTVDTYYKQHLICEKTR